MIEGKEVEEDKEEEKKEAFAHVRYMQSTTGSAEAKVSICALCE
jgi:hypothetical protein